MAQAARKTRKTAPAVKAATAPARKSRARTRAKRKPGKKPTRWSADVTRRSDALDLEPSVFTARQPADIARSLKRSAEHSHRRKSEPYRSAMSMLTFYINRAGDNLPAKQKRVLEDAKGELRKLFGRDED